MLEALAQQVQLADRRSCPSIGSLPLCRVVTRTAAYLRSSDARNASRISDAERRIRVFLRTARIDRRAIPADQKDFTTIATLLSTALSLVPTAGGPLTTAIVGLVERSLGPARDRDTVALADLPVQDALTSIGYGYAVTTQIAAAVTGQVGSAAGSALSPSTGGVNVWNLVPSPWGLINAPNKHRIAIYDDTLRSLCLAGDTSPG